MKNLMPINSHRKPAFTVVELLVVIVVIAILALISVIVYNTITKSAVETAMQSDLTQAARLLAIDKTRSSTYPLTKEQANRGNGLKASDQNEFQYSSDGQAYCLTVTTTRTGVSTSYKLSSSDSEAEEGVCAGHTGPAAGGGGTEIANNSPIQNVTPAQCAALPTYTGANETAVRTVTDSRGGTAVNYRIGKLADGKCWMLDNLRLGLTSGGSITLTESDSDVSGSITLPMAIAINNTSYDTPRVYRPNPGPAGTTYNYLYNWSAATARESRTTKPIGSSNAAHSICPAGWRLPTGGASGEFAMLNAKMNNPAATSPSTTGTAGYRENWHMTGPFKGNLAGYFSDGAWENNNTMSNSYAGAGGIAYWWSSTPATYHENYALVATLSGTGPSVGSVTLDGIGAVRNMGASVRCVLR